MNAKTLLTLTLLLISTLTLTACNPLKGYGQEAGAGGSKRSGLQNARGGMYGVVRVNKSQVWVF